MKKARKVRGSKVHGLGPRHMRTSISTAQRMSNRYSSGAPSSAIHGHGPRTSKNHNPFKQRPKKHL